MPRAIFLGTNGWYSTVTGNTVCTLLEFSNFNVILDAGDGLSKLGEFIDFEKPTYLYLSHLHLDHISGLHVLPKYVFTHDLHILISEKSVDAFNVFLNFPYTVPAKLFKKFLKYEVKVVPLPVKSGSLPFVLTVLPLLHPVETTAVRIEAENMVVSYVSDTGYCENAVAISRNADLLIAECSFKSGEKNEFWPHLNPEETARIASEAGCKRLVMTHFDASKYDSMSGREEAALAAKKIFRNTIAARDRLIFEF